LNLVGGTKNVRDRVMGARDVARSHLLKSEQDAGQNDGRFGPGAPGITKFGSYGKD
jgi:hypothetical protein